MKYKLLGRSGIRVSELCLGTMTFGNERGWGTDPTECRAIFDAFVEAGGNFFDTANIYQGGQSEEILGQLVKGDRDRHVIATKYSLAPPAAEDPNVRGNSRKSLIQSVEGSLRRLGTDYIDLFWVHAWDGHTEEQEMLRALDDLVRQGKALAIGFSDTPAWVVSRLQTLAEIRGWSPLSAVQFTYNLIDRSAERELIPMSIDLGQLMTVWGGLAGGMLSGKYGGGEGEGRLSRPGMEGGRFNERNFRIVDVVRSVAADLQATPSQVALAWLRQQSPQIVPIIGARTIDQLQDNLACLDQSVGGEERASLEEASAIDQGFPREFLLRGAVTSLLHGTDDRVSARRRV